MITRLSGTLNNLMDDRARLQVGPIEYELLISESTRRQLQGRLGEEVTLHTSHYLEAAAMQSRIIPRLLGFFTEAEQEFFDLFCTVDKVGARKALKAMAHPVRDLAEAIQRQDEKFLGKLPGIGAATAEKIVATLRKKVVKFCLVRADAQPAAASALPSQDDLLVDQAIAGLIGLGHSPNEARTMVERTLARGQRFETLEDLFLAVYEQSR